MSQSPTLRFPSGMQDYVFRPGTMLFCMVGRHRGETLVNAAKDAGARGGTIALGRSMENSSFLQALSLADVSQDVILMLLGQEAEAVINTVCETARKSPKKLHGLALVLDIAGMRVRVQSDNAAAPAASADQSRSIPMENRYVLITAIVNNGYADDVMAKARTAGATGGTTLNARGTGTSEDVKFFGITLVPEKEMLHIIAPEDKVEAILEAINTVPNLCKPGGGIVYCMNVENFIVLGK